jgi:hypothetical protein
VTSPRMILIAASVLCLSGTAHAACREDLVTTAQNVERARTQVKDAEGKAAAVQCAAYRQHVSALNGVKTVFARCDLGANKGKNAAQVSTTIAAVTKQMRASCKG